MNGNNILHIKMRPLVQYLLQFGQNEFAVLNVTTSAGSRVHFQQTRGGDCWFSEKTNREGVERHSVFGHV